jgi:DNA-binding transcriptional MerR regulator/methylmalonyl-CoA mutase cobalamin-binding subunit
MPTDSPPGLRIGVLSRRLEVSAQLLRAWESRYGLLRPARSDGGYRLYAASDERRVRRMQAHLARGLSAAEAARAALSEEDPASPAIPVFKGSDSMTAAAAAMAASLETFDESGAQAALDRLLADFTVESVVQQVIIPYLHDLGRRWAAGQASVAGEHFASSILRGRLAGLARGWGDGRGPRALLACPPGEQHDIALTAFGITLHRNGWRVNYLGPDTPLGDLAQAAREISPDAVVLSAVTPSRCQEHIAALTRLAAIAPLALAGAGATETLTLAVGAQLLAGDPVTEAQRTRTPGA